MAEWTCVYFFCSLEQGQLRGSPRGSQSWHRSPGGSALVPFPVSVPQFDGSLSVVAVGEYLSGWKDYMVCVCVFLFACVCMCVRYVCSVSRSEDHVRCHLSGPTHLLLRQYFLLAWKSPSVPS